MNRRRWFIAFAVLLPIAIFGAAKWATRWRPVAIGPLIDQPQILVGPPQIMASERLVRVSNGTLYDLQTNQRTQTQEDLVGQGTWMWSWDWEQPKDHLLVVWQLLLRDGTKPPVNYNLETPVGYYFSGDGSWVRISDAENRVEMLIAASGEYYRWNYTSRAIEIHTKFALENGPSAVSRDGATYFFAEYHAISAFSTRDGHLIKRVPLAIRSSSRGRVQISPFGSYALYPVENGAALHWNVVDARSGQLQWKFDLEGKWNYVSDSSELYAAISPDENWIALPFPSRKTWEIRDSKNGRLVRTIPLLPDTQSGAFSPDNSTLYSVANGVLYRQRAR